MDPADGASCEQIDAMRLAQEMCEQLADLLASGQHDERLPIEMEVVTALREGSTDIIDALFNCIVSERAGADGLARLFLTHSNDVDFHNRVNECVRLARKQNRQALHLLAAATSGCLNNMAASEKSSAALQHLCGEHPALISEVAQYLALAYRDYGDTGCLLLTLSLIACEDPDGIALTLALSCLADSFQQSVKQGDEPLKARVLKSYAALAKHLRVHDLQLFAEHLSPPVLTLLERAEPHISQAGVEALLNKIENALVSYPLEKEDRVLHVKVFTLFGKRASVLSSGCPRLAVESSEFSPYVLPYLVSALQSPVAAEAFDHIIMNGRCLDAFIDERTQRAIASYLTGQNYRLPQLLSLIERCQAFKSYSVCEGVIERALALCKNSETIPDEELAVLEAALKAHVKTGSFFKAKRVRRLLAESYQRIYIADTSVLADKLLRLAESAVHAKDWTESENFAKLALLVRKRLAKIAPDDLAPCLELLCIIARKQGNEELAESWAAKLRRLEAGELDEDEIKRGLVTYVSLPEHINLMLRPSGITLETDDFPRLIHQSTGLDLRSYFIDALNDAPGLAAEEKAKLAAELFDLFDTVTAFSSNETGATMHRSCESIVSLPPGLSQGIVQQMLVGPAVKFTFEPQLPDEVTFVDVSGISFRLGERILALADLQFKVLGDKCLVTPVFRDHGGGTDLVKNQFSFNSLANKGRELLAGAIVRMGKLSMELPVVLEEFRSYARDSAHFKSVLQDADKDLLLFIERTAGIKVDEPITRAMLAGCRHIVKNGENIRLNREEPSHCDLGGVVFTLAASIQMNIARTDAALEIEQITGLGMEVPFDAPPELHNIGLDLRRSLPSKMISLSISGPDVNGQRKLVAGIAPERWIAVDMFENMQPLVDAEGNWRLYGVTSNPITGNPQRFYLKLDAKNQVAMSAKDIADLLSQTALDGFDVSDPDTWKWGAVAIGGRTVATAGDILKQAKEEAKSVRKYARKLGGFLNRLIEEL